MMKSKKLMVVFILMVAFLLLMATFVKADDGVLQIITNNEQGSTQNPTGNNNESNNETNNVANVSDNTSAGNNTTLPQTGVASDTTLFIFIGVCIVSAVYAYIKIKNYNNVH